MDPSDLQHIIDTAPHHVATTTDREAHRQIFDDDCHPLDAQLIVNTIMYQNWWFETNTLESMRTGNIVYVVARARQPDDPDFESLVKVKHGGVWPDFRALEDTETPVRVFAVVGFDSREHSENQAFNGDSIAVTMSTAIYDIVSMCGFKGNAFHVTAFTVIRPEARDVVVRLRDSETGSTANGGTI